MNSFQVVLVFAIGVVLGCVVTVWTDQKPGVKAGWTDQKSVKSSTTTNGPREIRAWWDQNADGDIRHIRINDDSLSELFFLERCLLGELEKRKPKRTDWWLSEVYKDVQTVRVEEMRRVMDLHN